MGRTAASAALLLATLAGCGQGAAASPPQVRVAVGGTHVALQPSQYCLDGQGKVYKTTPPVVAVLPHTPISFTVPEAVARQGWSVQVFDNTLKQQIGEVHVGHKTVYREINTSDVVPTAFYLVVVEDKGTKCGEFSGAWPVGFVRAGNDQVTSPPGSPSVAP